MTRINTQVLWIFAAAAIVFAPQYALAQNDIMPDAETVPEEESVDLGWNPWFTIGGNISFGHNHNVIGKQDGQTWTLGASIDTGIDYQKGQHDWRNSLLLLESFTFAPPVNEFVKSADSLTLKSIYYYKIKSVPWLGPFVKFQLDTSIFQGVDYRDSDSNSWYRLDDAGNRVTINTGKQFKLTDYGYPLTLKESIGLFARPYSNNEIEWEFRAGFGAHEVFADDQLALTGTEGDDDLDGINEIEVKDLQNYIQGGVVAGTSIRGKLYKDKFTYEVWADLMFPVVRTNKDMADGNAAELMNVDLGARLSFALVDWASLDYEFKAVRQPQLIDGFQLMNMLLLTFKYTPVQKKTAETVEGE